MILISLTGRNSSFTLMELQDLFLVAVSTIGFISACNIFIRLLKTVWVNFLRPPKNLHDYGSWALITGCTNGIGKSLAVELASKGLNLILVGRNPSKLEAVRKSILEMHGDHQELDVRTIVIDFAKFQGEEILREIEDGVKGLDVGIVINNAGLSNPYAKYFHEVGCDFTESVVKVNLVATTWVTRAVLPSMLRKNKGAIVNIGSGSSLAVPSYPLFTTYAATKAYISEFSKNISLEYKRQGVDIQCQVPSLVATKMSSIRRTSFFIPSADTFSKASLRYIGYESVCMPYWPHFVQWCITDMLPDAFVNWLILSYFLGMRERGIKKDARLAKTPKK